MNSLAVDLRRALNPAALAPVIGMNPDPWQEDVLRSPHPRILLNCHRQSGKSTVGGVKGVHKAVYNAGSLTLLFSPSQRQSGELFRKCVNTYERLGRPVIAEAENSLSLSLENGSRIISMPGDGSTVRGFSGVDLIIIDEAAQVKDGLIAAVRPMLAVSGGALIALSTPFGKRGWFYEAWANGGPNWKRVEVTADKCPRITAAFLEEERAALGEWLFLQEYFCKFVETSGQVFGSDIIKEAFSREVEPLVLAP